MREQISEDFIVWLQKERKVEPNTARTAYNQVVRALSIQAQIDDPIYMREKWICEQSTSIRSNVRRYIEFSNDRFPFEFDVEPLLGAVPLLEQLLELGFTVPHVPNIIVSHSVRNVVVASDPEVKKTLLFTCASQNYSDERKIALAPHSLIEQIAEFFNISDFSDGQALFPYRRNAKFPLLKCQIKRLLALDQNQRELNL